MKKKKNFKNKLITSQKASLILQKKSSSQHFKRSSTDSINFLSEKPN